MSGAGRGKCCLIAKHPCPWHFPGKKTGLGYHSSPGVFPNQELNLHLSHWQADSFPLSNQGSLVRVNREKEKDVNIHDGNSGRVCVNIFGTTCSSAQSCPTLCNPMDHSPPGSSVDGISEARNMEWVATSSSGDLPNPEIKPAAGGFFATEAPRKSCFGYSLQQRK